MTIGRTTTEGFRRRVHVYEAIGSLPLVVISVEQRSFGHWMKEI